MTSIIILTTLWLSSCVVSLILNYKKMEDEALVLLVVANVGFMFGCLVMWKK